MASVRLAVSPLGGVPGATAYHTSILLGDEEFSFGHTGIVAAPGTASHIPTGGNPTIHDFGASIRTGRHVANQLVAVLSPHFRQHSYDLLKKNCNTFSDVALFFLTRQRLSSEYKALERFGSSMPALVRVVSGGCYAPNPLAEGFDLEALIRILDSDRESRALRYAADRYSSCPSALGLLSWLPFDLGACLAPLADPALQADMDLARHLQAEEEDVLADEQFARALQAEEDASGREAAPSSTRFGRFGLPGLRMMRGRRSPH
uniref:PPPDE domain-containing protein n=1 Tax=Alexandrium andersonii TaxID=327968 RepID=A0A7S2B183_9DINO